MSKPLKLEAIAVIVVLLAVGLFFYTNYSSKRQSPKEALNNKILELNSIVSSSHDCVKVVDEANAYITEKGDSEELWNILGVCQFDMGKFDDARKSFQKVLTLNPQHIGAQNYLQRLNFNKGEVVVTGAETPFDQKQFESKIGLDFKDVLVFVKAVQKPANIPQFLLANYTGKSNFERTVSALKDLAKKSKTKFDSYDTNLGTVISYVGLKEIKIISIEKGNGTNVKVTMNYQKLSD